MLFGNGFQREVHLPRDPLLLHILGDYGQGRPRTGVLMQHREGRHEEELADLRGVRFATCVESGVDQAFDEPRLKQITGGDTISARHLYQPAVPVPAGVQNLGGDEPSSPSAGRETKGNGGA